MTVVLVILVVVFVVLLAAPDPLPTKRELQRKTAENIRKGLEAFDRRVDTTLEGFHYGGFVQGPHRAQVESSEGTHWPRGVRPHDGSTADLIRWIDAEMDADRREHFAEEWNQRWNT